MNTFIDSFNSMVLTPVMTSKVITSLIPFSTYSQNVNNFRQHIKERRGSPRDRSFFIPFSFFSAPLHGRANIQSSTLYVFSGPGLMSVSFFGRNICCIGFASLLQCALLPYFYCVKELEIKINPNFFLTQVGPEATSSTTFRAEFRQSSVIRMTLFHFIFYRNLVGW